MRPLIFSEPPRRRPPERDCPAGLRPLSPLLLDTIAGTMTKNENDKNRVRGAIKLELRCPQTVGGIVVDPQPDWSFNTLLSELTSIEKKLNASSGEVSSTRSVERRAFVMRVDEIEDVEEDSEEAHDQTTGSGDDSEDELPCESRYALMDKVGFVEGALSELTHEHQLSVTEEIRNRVLTIETDLINEHKRFYSALDRVKKYTAARQEMDRKLDMQYQRRIAEALDNHLTAVQRDHEHKSQIEERRIRDDAAFEEAKRREKALQEEKLRQEKLRAEAEYACTHSWFALVLMCMYVLESGGKISDTMIVHGRKWNHSGFNYEYRLDLRLKRELNKQKQQLRKLIGRQQKEASEKVAREDSARAATAAVVAPKEATESQTGNILKCAESALKLEERRLQIYKEVTVKNEALGFGSSINHLSHGSKIQRLIKQISGTKENVRSFDQCTNPNKAVFAYAHVIVLVASQSQFDTKEAYHKAIGYNEDDGGIESEESYISRVESYMRLYGALVQTEIAGVQNTHGVREGWAWLARFLNALPANLYTAVALQAFLEVAGFALYRTYKTQFKKLLNIIYRDFVSALKERGGDAKLSKVITSIQTYIESNKFLEEPEGSSLQSTLLSHTFVPESEYAEPSYHRPANRFYYQY
ncbi:hypothetical protein Acr_07g0016600 [Actinidia rufa]|uniref:mRNA export factor GLE1 n=1 Tax=Actinidia rufa TaxID=165716 RepID=A0A7J0EYD4_9ERIC|nr:hypothetical protein Acr_07g0016600 [Actinidia rufa]